MIQACGVTGPEEELIVVIKELTSIRLPSEYLFIPIDKSYSKPYSENPLLTMNDRNHPPQLRGQGAQSFNNCFLPNWGEKSVFGAQE